MLPAHRAVFLATDSASPPPVLSTGEALAREAPLLRRHSADASRNDPLLRNALSTLRRGLTANPTPVSADASATKAFGLWARECGHTHSCGSFASIQRIVAHHLLQDGECFVQRVFTGSSYSSNGLLLAVWPKRLVDTSRGHNFTGHEYADGMWSGTWFQAETIEPGFQQYQPVFVPRDNLIWVRYVFEGDHVEGVPFFHAAIESASQLGEFAHADLVSKRVNACVAAIALVKDSLYGPRFGVGPQITDADGNQFQGINPGSLIIAQGVDDVKTIVPSAGSGIGIERYEGRVAAGTGLPREIVTGDLSAANFSTMRYAVLIAAQVVKALAVEFDPFRHRALDWFLEAELGMGRDLSGAEFEWLSRPVGVIDPLKAAEAEEVLVRLGVKSRRQVIEESGRIPEQVFAEIAAERGQFGAPEDAHDVAA